VQQGGVFINYRGIESRSYAALLHVELCRHFDRSRVFLDSESIPAGADFATQLLDRVRRARVVLAVIGTGWLTAADELGRRCIDDPADWVRRELAEAFAAGVRVIPVLVDGAALPACGELPPQIAGLGRCQYRQLRHRDASADIARLVADIGADPPGDPVNWPVVVGRPPARADAFQERPGLRAAMVRGPATVVVGDAGTGKTQLAAAAFTEALPGVSLAVWVTATSRTAVVSAYGQAYRRLFPLPELRDVEECADRFMAWLATTEQPWLLALDDVAAPGDIAGLWPAGPAGRVVLTTRRRDAAMVGRGRLVDVGAYTPAEAAAYLAAKLAARPGVPADVLVGAGALAADLGWLPLALAQAAAVIFNDGITCEQYRDRLADRSRRLAELFPADPAAATQGDPRSRKGCPAPGCTANAACSKRPAHSAAFRGGSPTSYSPASNSTGFPNSATAFGW
jgi:hypothetical protein